MKKIALLVGLALVTQVAISQNKFRFGLKIAPSVNWLKPDDVKKFTNNGSSFGFGGGLTGEYMISDNFSIYSGIELHREKGKVNFEPIGSNSIGVYYFMNREYAFLETVDNNGSFAAEDTSAYTLRLKNREYKNNYVSIPIGIKMKTKEIGYMTYFGEFGLNLAFRTGTKITDEVEYFSTEAQADLADISDVNMDKDMQPLRVQLRFGLGAEYKISEGTSLFGGLHYNLGFTNVVKGDSKFLVSPNSSLETKPVSQNFKAHGIQVTVGVLF